MIPMRYRSPAGLKQLAMAAAVLLLAAALAGCTSAIGVLLASDESAPANVSAVESVASQPFETPRATGSGSCAGCFSHTGNDPDTPAPSPYAVDGVAVRYDDPTCIGQCVEGCVCVCAESGCAKQLASDTISGGGGVADKPVAGSPCSAGQAECACDCVCTK